MRVVLLMMMNIKEHVRILKFCVKYSSIVVLDTRRKAVGLGDNPFK